MIDKHEAKKTGVITGKDLLTSESHEMKFLVQHLFARGSVGTLAGQPGCGKSSFAKQLSYYTVQGKEEIYGKRMSAEHQRALYVITEDSPESTREWLIRQQEKLTDEQQENLIFYFDEGLGPKHMLHVTG
jgi:KaiC/GvpD/RAD55 family RecA-like ATPase